MRHICFMPAYNAEKLMEGVIRKIPPEAWEKLEFLLVVNDGSTDGTGDLARSLMESYPKIRLVEHGKNRGYGEARKPPLNGPWKRVQTRR